MRLRRIKEVLPTSEPKGDFNCRVSREGTAEADGGAAAATTADDTAAAEAADAATTAGLIDTSSAGGGEADTESTEGEGDAISASAGELLGVALQSVELDGELAAATDSAVTPFCLGCPYFARA